MSDLERLATLIHAKNEADRQIAEVLGRPTLTGNIGEYVAMHVFGIDLMKAGNHPGHDGVFRDPPLAGKTVNIKTYSRNEYVIDISPHPCDYYLVLAGPPGQARVRPWVIDAVYLFDALDLVAKLRERKVKIGVATGTRKGDWESARIFPAWSESPLKLDADQIDALTLFADV